MLAYLKACSAMTKFILFPSPSLHKLTNIFRYYSIYLRMLEHNNTHHLKFKSLYDQHINQKTKLSLSAQLSSTKQSIQQKLYQLNIKKSAQQTQNILKQSNINIKQTLKYYVNKAFEYMGLYYESLQNMVEGKRQVLHNQKYMFQDGETVQQKSDKFQRKLRQLMGKNGKLSKINQEK